MFNSKDLNTNKLYLNLPNFDNLKDEENFKVKNDIDSNFENFTVSFIIKFNDKKLKKNNGIINVLKDKRSKFFMSFTKDNILYIKLLMEDDSYETIYSDTVKNLDNLIFFIITVDSKELNIIKNGVLEKNIYFGNKIFNSFEANDLIHFNKNLVNINIFKFCVFKNIVDYDNLIENYNLSIEELTKFINNDDINFIDSKNNMNDNIPLNKENIKKKIILTEVKKISILFKEIFSKKTRVYSNDGLNEYSNVQLKRFIEEVKKISWNFVWVFKSLSLLSPSILNNDDVKYGFDENRSYIKKIFNYKLEEESQNNQNHINLYFPIFYIELSRLVLFLKEFFNIKDYIINILKFISKETNSCFYICTHKFNFKSQKYEKLAENKLVNNYEEIKNGNFLHQCYIVYDKILYILRYLSLNTQQNNEIDLKLIKNNDNLLFENDQKSNLNNTVNNNNTIKEEDSNSNSENIRINMEIKFKELFISKNNENINKVIIENINGEINKIILVIDNNENIFNINNEIVINNEIDRVEYNISEKVDEINLGFNKNQWLKLELINNNNDIILVDFNKSLTREFDNTIKINNGCYKKEIELINYINSLIENFKILFISENELKKIKFFHNENCIYYIELHFNNNDNNEVIKLLNETPDQELSSFDIDIDNIDNLNISLGVKDNSIKEVIINEKSVLKFSKNQVDDSISFIKLDKDIYLNRELPPKENKKDIEIPQEKDYKKFNSRIINEEVYNEHKERLKENFYQIFHGDLTHNKINFYYFDDFIYNIDFNIKNKEDEIFDLRIILEEVENEEEIIEHLFRKEIELKSKQIEILEFILIDYVIIGLNVYEVIDSKLVNYNFYLENYNNKEPDMIIRLNRKDFDNFNYNPDTNQNQSEDDENDEDYDIENQKIDEEKNDLFEKLVYPKEYDTSILNKLQLRWDVSFYNKNIYEKLKKSINKDKFKLIKYCSKFNDLHDYFRILFENSIMIPNLINPSKLGEFTIYALGLADNTDENYTINSRNKDEIFKKNSIILFDKIPIFSQFFDQIFFLIIKNNGFENLVEKQKKNWELLNISKPLSVINLADIENDEDINNINKTNKNNIEEYICSNYGCQNILPKENNDNCKFHFGKWDFGHLGTNLMETMRNKNLILWKPHWTCCGQDWMSSCVKIHKHNLINKNNFKELPYGFTFDKIGQCNFYKKNSKRWLFDGKNKNLLCSPDKISSILKENITYNDDISFDEQLIDVDKLPYICDKLKLQLLAITQDLSYHFKYLDVLENKAQKYLDNGKEKITVGNFLTWWNSDLKTIVGYTDN